MVSVAQRQDPWLFLEKRAEEEQQQEQESMQTVKTQVCYTLIRDREGRFLSTGLSQKSRAGKHMAARIMTYIKNTVISFFL